MDLAHELLNKLEYFTCERFHCRLRIEICVGRQKANKQPRKPLNPIPFEGCEDCDQGEKIMQQLKAANENIRICETEACENKTITPKHRLCGSCLAQKANAAKAAKKQNPVKSNRKANSKGKGKAEKSILVPISKPIPIQIDFGKHTPVLDEIRGLAEEEMRPLEWQILYMLKTHLKVIKEDTLQTS